jgi:hypothetical protein
MRTSNKDNLSEQEIDRIVVGQADDDSAWEKPVRGRSTKTALLSIPASLASRAAFLARLHRDKVDAWLTRIIQDRVELEEAAFAGAKQALTTGANCKRSGRRATKAQDRRAGSN